MSAEANCSIGRVVPWVTRTCKNKLTAAMRSIGPVVRVPQTNVSRQSSPALSLHWQAQLQVVFRQENYKSLMATFHQPLFSLYKRNDELTQFSFFLYMTLSKKQQIYRMINETATNTCDLVYLTVVIYNSTLN